MCKAPKLEDLGYGQVFQDLNKDVWVRLLGPVMDRSDLIGKRNDRQIGVLLYQFTELFLENLASSLGSLQQLAKLELDLLCHFTL